MTSPSVPMCEFCLQHPGPLLCDAIVSGDAKDSKVRQTCDRRMCRNCAGQPITTMHINRGSRGSGWDSRDICPECKAAGRKTGFER